MRSSWVDYPKGWGGGLGGHSLELEGAELLVDDLPHDLVGGHDG